MEHTPHLYDTLVRVLGQQAPWVEQRHLKTLAWLMVGLLHAGWITRTAWAPSVVSRAQDAQSTVRRCRRWLDHGTMDAVALDGPLIEPALGPWGEPALSVALDTSLLWHPSCLIRLSVISRGRAVPLGWCGLHHGRAQVACKGYQDLLERAALLLPRHCPVSLLADRGLADTERMAYLPRLGWHGRMRIKRRFWLYRRGRPRGQVERRAVARGQAWCWQQVSITDKRDGPVHLAVARPWQGQEVWYGLSDEPTDEKTCKEYGVRFDIAENF